MGTFDALNYFEEQKILIDWFELHHFSIGVTFFCINSLCSGRCGSDLKCLIFKPNLIIDILIVSLGIVLSWMPQDNVDDKSTFVLVMAWCCQATSHYLNQCWRRSMTPYGITRPQWVKWNGSWTPFWCKGHLSDVGFPIVKMRPS